MYFIIGGTGFLGSYMEKAIQEQTKESIITVSRSPKEPGGYSGHITCDISSKDDLDRIASIINSIHEQCKIICLAACHNPEKIEEDPWESWTVNVTGLNYLLSRLKKPAAFVFASTDAVYGESVDGYRYTEADRIDPVSLYGIQKSAGEMVVTHYGYHVMRYPLLMGASISAGRKHFYDVIKENLQAGIPTELFRDAYRCMLDYKSAAELTVTMIEKHIADIPQIMNISGDEALSKYDIGIRMARRYNLPENLIVPIEMTNDHRIFKTRRAASILTDNSLLKKTLSLTHVNFVL